MKYEELQSLIIRSGHNDWIREEDDMVSSHKHDLRVRIKRVVDSGRKFSESWTQIHPDQDATAYKYEILYDNNIVETTILVNVDGGRSDLPIPLTKNLSISKYQYGVAKAVNILDNLEVYLRASGISVEEGLDAK